MVVIVVAAEEKAMEKEDERDYDDDDDKGEDEGVVSYQCSTPFQQVQWAKANTYQCKPTARNEAWGADKHLWSLS